MRILTIDGGITNTRAAVFDEDKLVAFVKEEIGIRQTHLTSSDKILKQGVKKAIKKALQMVKLCEEEIDLIFASGMITSNLGLFEVPHILLPATIQKQAKSVVVQLIKDVFPRPIHFIPGVKFQPKDMRLDLIEKIDFVRGEETEVRGILSRQKINLPAAFILPGSHTKIVLIDNTQAIVGSTTFITGEMIQAIMKETIIGNSLPEKLISRVEPKFFLFGADTSLRFGLTKTLFCVRIFERLLLATPNQRANFFIGAILGTDFFGMRQFMKKAKEIIVGGHKNLKQLYGILLKSKSRRKVTTLPDKIAEEASSYGAFEIAKIWLKQNERNKDL